MIDVTGRYMHSRFGTFFLVMVVGEVSTVHLIHLGTIDSRLWV